MARATIYFVSDLHLGDGTGADRFRYPQQFLNLLSRIEADPGAQLVLLGDVLELWACPLEGVLVAHAPLFAALGRLARTHPVTYVVGNHDSLPFYYFLDQGMGPIRVAERFTAGGGKLVALHGHQFDPFNQIKVEPGGTVKEPWTRRLVEIIGFLGRVGGPAAGNAIADLSDQLQDAARGLEQLLPEWDETARGQAVEALLQTKAMLDRESPGERNYPLETLLYDEAARKLMREGAQFVLMGHTHHPLVGRYGSKLYVNTGCWCWDRYPPTYARFAGGKLELLDANTHQPYVPQPSPPEA